MSAVESSRHAGARFPETEWSLIAGLADDAVGERRQRLNRLLTRYWQPVFHYVRAIARSTDADAEDATQAFFTSLLERVHFAELSPNKGSFRTFLKIALRNHLISEGRRRNHRVRTATVPLSEASEPMDDAQAASLEELFDRAWVAAVMNQANAALSKELSESGRAIYFDVFRDYCLSPAEGVSYESVARQHGISEDDVRNYLRFARGRGRLIVREIIARTLMPGQDVDEELRALLLG